MGRHKDNPWQVTGFGMMLRYWRSRRCLTQENLARRAGLTCGTISKLELGKQEPHWPEVIRLALALGQKTDDFRLKEGEELQEMPEHLKKGPTPKPGSKPRKKKTE